MKIGKYILVSLLSFIVVISCTKSNDTLKNTPAQRSHEALKYYSELLMAPQNGWYMEYYSGGKNRDHGGVILTVKFDKDGKCSFKTPMEDNKEKGVRSESGASSFYTLGLDQGPTLNFDTYNKILHSYSDPDPSSGNGLKGDYEFILMSGNDKEVVLQGKKYHNIIKMYPLVEADSVFLKKVHDNMATYTNKLFYGDISGVFGGRPFTGQIKEPLNFLLTQGDQSVSVPFLFTDKGMKLYQPISMNGRTLTELEWHPEDNTFVSPDKSTIIRLKENKDGLRFENYLGDYKFQCHGANGVDKEFNVQIVPVDGDFVVVKGLPFTLFMKYVKSLGVLELPAQKVKINDSNDEAQLALWDAVNGALTWQKGVFLNTKWNRDPDKKEFTFVAGGDDWFYEGKKIFVNAFILWKVDGSGAYDQIDSRFYDITLIKQ